MAFTKEIHSLPACSPVADGDDLGRVLLCKGADGGDCLHFLRERRMGKYGLEMKKLALLVEADHLAAGTESRVYRHHPLPPDRRREKKLAQVGREDSDGLDVGLFLGFTDDFIFYRGAEKTLQGVFQGLFYLFFDSGRRIAPDLAGSPVHRGVAVVVIYLACAFLEIRIDTYGEESLFGSAEHSEKVMGGNLLYGHTELEIGTVLPGFFRLLAGLGHFRTDHPLTEKIAQRLAEGRRLGEALGNDVTGTRKGVVDRGHLALDIAGRFGGRIGRFASPQCVRKRFQALCGSHGSLRLPLGAERQIEVLELLRIDSPFNAGAEIVGQGACLVYCLEDEILALFHSVEDIDLVADGAHLLIVEATGPLLAVAAYEGNGAAVGEKIGAVFHLPGLYREQGGDMIYIQLFHTLQR